MSGSRLEASAAAPNRRARLREQTVGDIKRAALDQVRAEGAAALSLRGVARALGMSGPGLYRYYAGRDDLLTALITDAYDDLGATLEAARDGAQGRGDGLDDRFLACGRAYLAWARAHPEEYGLLFGTPLPGYAAPAGGPTVRATERYSRVLVELLVDIWSTRWPASRRKAALAAAPGLTAAVAATGRPRLLGVPPDDPGLVLLVARTWTHVHGLVTLAVTGHLGQSGLDDRAVDAILEAELRELLSPPDPPDPLDPPDPPDPHADAGG